MLKYKIQIELFVLNLRKKCSCVLCVFVFVFYYHPEIQDMCGYEVINILINKITYYSMYVKMSVNTLRTK
jgi:hypothetical protein